jgi:hypothetical protein
MLTNNIILTIIVFSAKTGNTLQTSSCYFKQRVQISHSHSMAKGRFLSFQNDKSISKSINPSFDSQRNHKHFLMVLLLQKKDR